MYVPRRLAQAFPADANETTVYTVQGGLRAIVKQVVIANVTPVAALASVSFVPSGGAAADGNRAMKDVQLEGRTITTLDLAQVLDAGDLISVKSSVASALVFTVSGVEMVMTIVPVTGIQVARDGVLAGTRSRVNLIEGANIVLTVEDDAVTGEVDVTIASTASGGGGGETDPVVFMGGF